MRKISIVMSIFFAMRLSESVDAFFYEPEQAPEHESYDVEQAHEQAAQNSSKVTDAQKAEAVSSKKVASGGNGKTGAASTPVKSSPAETGFDLSGKSTEVGAKKNNTSNANGEFDLTDSSKIKNESKTEKSKELESQPKEKETFDDQGKPKEEVTKEKTPAEKAKVQAEYKEWMNPFDPSKIGDWIELIGRLILNPVGCETTKQVRLRKKAEKTAQEKEALNKDIKMKESSISGLKKTIEIQKNALKVLEQNNGLNLWESPEITAKKADIAKNQSKLAQTQTELESLQLKATGKVVMTKEQNRQQVIEGIRQIMADGAIDLALVSAKEYAPKLINAEDTKSLNEQVDAINKLKDDLDPDVDQETIAQIDSLVNLVKGVSNTSTTGVISTAYNAYDAYNKGSLNVFMPTGEHITTAATKSTAVAKK